VNYARFGSPFKTGYHLAYPTATILLSNGLFSGLRDVLFDGEVGLVWFTPWVLALPFAWKRFRTKRPLECALSVAILLEGVLFFAAYVSWHGGWAYGPRLLLPCLPFAALPMVALFEKASSSVPASRIAIALVALSVAVQIGGMAYPMARYYQIENYHDLRDEPAQWGRSLVVAEFEDSPQVIRGSSSPHMETAADPGNTPSEESRAVVMTPAQYLASFPNSINFTQPDLWLVKAAKLGLPAPAIAFLSLILLAAGIVLMAWSLGGARQRDSATQALVEALDAPTTRCY
jgi:hypothetical protein